ncbi:hypothetical protein ACP70R_005069 [Stipagrostis hirtigluma subsp. patula]
MKTTTMAAPAASSRSRQPVPDNAEFSPEMTAMLRSRRGRAELASLLRRRDEAIRMKLRKHLLALGWTIVTTPNSVMAPRLRYDSPLDGKSYVSLPLLVETASFHALDEQHDQNPSPPQSQTHHHEQEDDDDDEAEDDDKDEEYTMSESDNDGDDDVILPAHTDEAPEQADAIAEYIECMEEHGWAKKSARAARLRASAKRHLESAGWTFWMKLKSNGREELRYRAPTGRSYISLLTACVAFRDAAAAAAPTPKPTSSNERKRLIVRVLRPGKTRGTDACSESSTVVNSPAAAAETTGESDETITTSMNKRKAPDDELTCAADGTVVKKFFTTKRRKISELFSAKDAVIKKCTTTKQRRTSELLCADGTLIKKCTTTTTTSKKKKKKKKPKKKAAAASKARVLRPRGKDDRAASPSACQRRSRTLLSVLVDKNILLPRDKVAYKETRDGPPVKEGIITGDGVKCACCNRAFTVAEFEAHATRRSCTDHPWSRVFLKDGRSLAQCLLQLMRLDGGVADKASLRVRRKEECTDPAGDSVCSICNDGGELVLCDHCPSTFHHDCLGLDAVPDGDWFCPSCRCSICDRSDFDPDAAAFTDKTIMYCDQCEREYHVGCVRDRGDELSCCPQGPWLCSTSCSKIFQHLQGLVGRTIPTSVEGLKLTILRSTGAHDRGEHDEAAMAEQHGKLCAALDVLHECFVTLIEPRTQSDLSADIVFNRESELRRLNFRGYYMIGLEKGGELITVGTLRVYGNKVAELPLVGTRFAHRRQGMCHLLMNELEKMLCALGVERLVLPAVPELLQTWTGSFGFRVMTHSDKLEIAEHTILSFQGTTMCHKFLSSADAPYRQVAER